MPKVKAELEAMEKAGIISTYRLVFGYGGRPKSDGRVRICEDLTMNESVKRDRHILPSVELSLAQQGDAKVFSKLDANSGFWQIKLDPESTLLITFITPFGS